MRPISLNGTPAVGVISGMSGLWDREPGGRERVAGMALLIVAAFWSVFRIARSLKILFAVSDDLYTYYALWSLMQFRDLADIALRQSLYLPHTWIFVTPLFLFGWPMARVLTLALNIAAIVYIWLRLSRLTGLTGIRKWLLLVFFCSWLGTGLVVGLGNLAIVCIAAALAAYPYSSPGNQVALAFSAMKQSLVFPLYLHLLLRKPKAWIIPAAIFACSGVAALVWARLSIPVALRMAAATIHSVGTWTQYDHLCLRRLLSLFVSEPTTLSLLNWATWFVLFGAVARFVRDPLAQLAGFLLLSLLPLYHNIYDMVAAVPVLAIMLQRGNLVWPAVLTCCLSTNVVAPIASHTAGPLQSFFKALESAYFPLIIITLIVFLCVTSKRGRASEAPAASSPQEIPAAA